MGGRGGRVLTGARQAFYHWCLVDVAVAKDATLSIERAAEF